MQPERSGYSSASKRPFALFFRTLLDHNTPPNGNGGGASVFSGQWVHQQTEGKKRY